MKLTIKSITRKHWGSNLTFGMYNKYHITSYNFQLTHGLKKCFVRNNNWVTQLDISPYEHEFNKEDITIIINNYFPCVEHLKINMLSLSNIILMQKYLIYLRSSTFEKERFRCLVDIYRMNCGNLSFDEKLNSYANVIALH